MPAIGLSGSESPILDVSRRRYVNLERLAYLKRFACLKRSACLKRLACVSRESFFYEETVCTGPGSTEIVDEVDSNLAVVDVVARVNGVTSTLLAAVANESVDRVLDDPCRDLFAVLEVLGEDADAAVAVVRTISATCALMASNLLAVAEDDVVGCRCAGKSGEGSSKCQRMTHQSGRRST
jgi:hypothetical protein